MKKHDKQAFWNTHNIGASGSIYGKTSSDDSKVIIWPQWSKQIKTNQNKTNQDY